MDFIEGASLFTSVYLLLFPFICDFRVLSAILKIYLRYWNFICVPLFFTAASLQISLSLAAFHSLLPPTPFLRAANKKSLSGMSN